MKTDYPKFTVLLVFLPTGASNDGILLYYYFLLDFLIWICRPTLTVLFTSDAACCTIFLLVPASLPTTAHFKVTCSSSYMYMVLYCILQYWFLLPTGFSTGRFFYWLFFLLVLRYETTLQYTTRTLCNL